MPLLYHMMRILLSTSSWHRDLLSLGQKLENHLNPVSGPVENREEF